eukprot:maker-scaffold286_size222086-snap-gene-1.22 protein:Tk07258 transcript:maker-scaffold286_size222086-snap-gene-1.22-mRNA-1 annotation:"hypothetical protein DAPPUDRAFT_255495"
MSSSRSLRAMKWASAAASTSWVAFPVQVLIDMVRVQTRSSTILARSTDIVAPDTRHNHETVRNCHEILELHFRPANYSVRWAEDLASIRNFTNSEELAESVVTQEAGTWIQFQIRIAEPWRGSTLYFAMKARDNTENWMCGFIQKMKVTACLALISLAFVPLEATISFKNNGYHNLLVAISPDIPADNADAIITGIKSWILEGSRMLASATHKYAYISNVKILVPTTWNYEEATTTTEYSFEDGNIVVDTENPVYGTAPHTLQHGLCGQRGEKILVSPDFFVDLETTSTELYGSPERLFVHEWAKFRYGVFEEHGYPGDEQYPMFYLKTELSSGGIVNEVVPNFCVDSDLTGQWMASFEGYNCLFNEVSNTPGEECVFIPDDSGNIRSSLMALPFLTNMDHFCEDGDGDFAHEAYIPTKHNALCGAQSVWAVIEGNDDFADASFKPGQWEEGPPDTSFDILKQDSARFVMVLDKSGSMSGPTGHNEEPRINRLKQAASRWILNDIWNGSALGVTSFCYDASVDSKMLSIDEASRVKLSNAVLDIKTCGSTCLGLGLKTGVETLTKDGSRGGVMIYVTDGEYNCNNQGGHDGSDLNDPAIKKLIEDNNIKVITIAFGKDADPNLENLATWSNGKTYFIPDGSGIDDLNDAFSGSLTYQPSIPTQDMEFVIHQEAFDQFDNPNGDEELRMEFAIDRTIGRDVKFTFDYTTEDVDSFKEVKIYKTDCEGPECIKSIDFAGATSVIYIQHLEPSLEVGLYELEIITKKKLRHCSVQITSKSKDATTMPFRTRCWATVGSEEIDVSKQPVGIVAEVMQGNRPVMNALVEASVEKAGQSKAIVIDLLDNGRGADLVANDGLYSRYFARFDGDDRYLIRCQVKGDESTGVNGGFTTSKKSSTDKAYPVQPGLAAPICCGSDTLKPNSKIEPTGAFERRSAGGSMKVTNTAQMADAPPIPVRDLQATYSLDNDTIFMSFSAPGNIWDDGQAKAYSIRFTQNSTLIVSSFNECEEIETEWLLGGSTLDPLEYGQTVQITLNATALEKDSIYIFAMKATSDKDKSSELSNQVFLALAGRTDIPEEPNTPPTGVLSGGAIAGIVLGTLLEWIRVSRSLLLMPRTMMEAGCFVLKRAGLSSLNELTVHAVAMEIWRAFHSQDRPGGSRNALGQILFPANVATRSEAAGVVSPHLPFAANTLQDNGIAMWNKFPALREASTKRMASN